jgi:hypothetical protein
MTAEPDTAKELMRLFTEPASSEATLDALSQASEGDNRRARRQRDLTVDVLGDSAVVPDAPERRMVAVRALRDPENAVAVQGVGAALYESSGTVRTRFVLADVTPTASPAGDPVAAASWVVDGDRRVLAYATSPDVTRAQLYVGRRPVVDLEPGIGVVDEPELTDAGPGSVPAVALLGFTSNGTVVPGTPVVRR